MGIHSKTQKEYEAILSVLASSPEGTPIKVLEASLLYPSNRRKTQRHLAKLKEKGLIKTIGKGKNTLYSHIQPSINQDIEKKIYPAHEISFSLTALELQKKITAPLNTRKTIGYNRLFLESYQPNQTLYLSVSELQHLNAIGKTGMIESPAGTYAKEILSRLLIDLSFNSSRLEGNTYSLLDTQRLITFGEAAEGKPLTDTQMILNHKDAIEFMVQSASDIGLNRYTILNLHALLANNLLTDPQAVGRLRYIPVKIAHSTYEPLSVAPTIHECFDLILTKARSINDPFEQAFFLMVHLPYLQPFDDVNKRVSRLAANIPLLQHNFCPLSFIEVPHTSYIQGLLSIYEFNQIELFKEIFIWSYEKSAARYALIQQSLGQPDSFRLRYRETLRSLIFKIIEQAMDQKIAMLAITEQAGKIPLHDQNRFIEVIQTELLSLHEGNFARYHGNLEKFHRWQKTWNRA